MKQTTNTVNIERHPYQAPAMMTVTLDAVPVLHSVSGSGDYDDIHYGGDGDGSYGD